jgi:hypothetical protein
MTYAVVASLVKMTKTMTKLTLKMGVCNCGYTSVGW